MWLAEQVELRTSSMTAPESGGRQPRIRRDLNDPLLLDPQTQPVMSIPVRPKARLPPTRSRRARKTGEGNAQLFLVSPVPHIILSKFLDSVK